MDHAGPRASRIDRLDALPATDTAIRTSRVSCRDFVLRGMSGDRVQDRARGPSCMMHLSGVRIG